MEKMKKIELYQLSFYLPYKIKGNVINNEYFEPEINKELFAINCDDNDVFLFVGETECTITECTIEDFKPILKSISDISQGEMSELFEMFGDLCLIGNQQHFNEFLRDHFENLDTLPLRICQELAKRGYDIFNLLQNNLAINFYSF